MKKTTCVSRDESLWLVITAHLRVCFCAHPVTGNGWQQTITILWDLLSLCCLNSLSVPEDRKTSSELSISTKSLSYSEDTRDSGTEEQDGTVSVVYFGFSSADSKLLRKFPGFPKKSPNLFQKWGFTLSYVQFKNVLPINLAGTVHSPYLIKTNTSSLCKKKKPKQNKYIPVHKTLL